MSEYILPMMLMVSGFALLFAGGEFLVRGASALAVAARISPLVIGLTVVAFGTSAPELAVTARASYFGQPDLAVGNVIGSNIANVLLILGLASVAAPLVVSSQLIRLDVPLMIAASVAMLLVGLDGEIGRLEGTALVVALIVYIGWSIRSGRREAAAALSAADLENAKPTSAREYGLHAFWIVLGLLLLTYGSRWLVQGATTVAQLWGVGELTIGLTIVALGTSLPEVATSVVASVRGERDIAAGNVVGSNLFNILSVLGLSAIFAPDGIPVSDVAIQKDIPIMLAVSVACLPIFFVGGRLDRWEGLLFLGYYVAYNTHLILEATHLQAARTFAAVMTIFVIPLTVVTLAVYFFRAWRQPAAPDTD